MQQEKKYWEGYLNADDGDAFVQFAEYINLRDFRFGTTSDKGFAKQLEAVGGNMLIPNPNLPTPNPLHPHTKSVCIGVAYDWSRRRVIYFTQDRGGPGAVDGIWCFDFVANKIYQLLITGQVVNGLGFGGDILIHSARVENNCVYWTDNLNEPRRINIDAAIKLNDPSYITDFLPYTAPLSQAVIAWIRRQPGLPPTQSKVVQTSPVVASNQVATEAFIFAYRYTYRDFEVSKLSGQSTLANYNADVEHFNRIDISIPFAEKIDQDVIQIDLVAIYLTSGIAFIINSWLSRIPADAAEIAAHNAGTTQLSYSFYNDRAGIALDAAYTASIFDNVPIKAQTIEMAKGRSFMGNYLTGYDTPITTSLTYTLPTVTYTPAGGGGTPTGTWFLLTFHYVVGTQSAYVLQTTFPVGPVPLGSLYYYTYSSVVPPYPPSVLTSDLTFRGHTAHEAALSIHGTATFLETLVNQGATSVVVGGSSPVITVVGTALKSNAAYQLSINFKDNYGRECGALTNNSLKFATTDLGLSNFTYTIGVNWLLSNANAINEIPDYAYYYSINITKCLRTRFFLQSLGVIIYADKDSSNNYTFTTTGYTPSLAGVAIDLTILETHAQGYVFAQGDAVEVFVNSNTYILSIIAQVNQWVVCQLVDVGNLSGVEGYFEIYTPYKSQTDEPYFEESQLYPVLNPGGILKTYSTITGTLPGDVYIFQRQNGVQYFTEAMNINDKFYKDWFTNAGRPVFVDTIGQVQRPSSIAYSETFIAYAKANGLSTYDALNTADISPDFGPIMKLQLSSKVAKIGSVMLAICSGPTTASIYLGENTLISQTGDSVVAQANTVIGSIHELKGSYGTLNPESVVELFGNIYWFDVQNGKVIQYADNGLFPISNYKCSRFWNLFANQYKGMSAAQIEALGSRPFVFGCADPHHGELLFTVPNTLATPPMGFLPDNPTVPYPFDIWDGIGKTMVFKLYATPNRWQGSYSIQPEYMCYMENNLYAFKAGDLYIQNQPNYANYFGTQYNPAVMVLSNQQLNKPKVYNAIGAEANRVPLFIYTMALYPNLQATELEDYQFKDKEGIWYATFMRNKLDPRYPDDPEEAIVKGERMRTTALYIWAAWDGTKGLTQVKFLDVYYTVSLGQPV